MIRWIGQSSTLAIHDEQIAEHGGIAGVRDMGLLESALARPQNLAVYGTPDLCDLAAAYAIGIAKNHPFLDGNKRTAWSVMETFLLKNGYEITADDRKCLIVMLAVADGNMKEAELAEWLRKNLIETCE